MSLVRSEMPFVIVKCCRRYVVISVLPIPSCPECGQTPTREDAHVS